MSKNVSIKKNYIYNTLYQAVNMLIPLVTAPYLSRIFGAGGVGIYSYTSSIVAIFVLIATFGTSYYGQREVAMNRDDRKKASKLFWEVEILNAVISIFCLLFWFIFVFISNNYNDLFLALSLQVLAVIFDISWLYAAYEDFKTILIRNGIIKLIGLILTFTLITSSSDLLLYIFIISCTVLFGNLTSWFKLSNLVDRVSIKTLDFKKHFKQTFIYFVPALATSVYTILDKAMIGYITKDEVENGYYEQATKIISIAKTLVFSFNTIMYARMSYVFAKKDFNKLKEMLNNSLNFICLIGIPLSFGLAGIAEDFVPWFFGDGYDNVILLIWLLSPIVFIVAVSNLIGVQYLTPIGKRKESGRVIIIGALTNFILNIWLIICFKSIGAIIASLVAELLITIVYINMSKGYISYKNIFLYSYKKIISAIIMLLSVLCIGSLLEPSILTTVIQVVIGSIVYFLGLFILKDNFINTINNINCKE